jgi:SPP1 family predicted phage head-tail adaptor
MATTTIGERRAWVTLQNPGPSMNDGQGNSTTPWYPLDPPMMKARIAPASAANLERITVGGVIAVATHVVTMRYHPQVTTDTQITYQGRTFYVKAVHNPDEKNEETIAVCQELMPPSATSTVLLESPV